LDDLSHPADRVLLMTALATRYVVITHVLSSTPAARLPAIWRSATFAIEVSSTSMNVAIETTIAMSQDCDRRQPSGLPHAAANRCLLQLQSSHFDRRHNPHARPETFIRDLVENDLDGHALHHLHIVAGGVFRGKQAEGRAASGLNAIDVARKDLSRIRRSQYRPSVRAGSG
jgi:hypothetical protein